MQELSRPGHGTKKKLGGRLKSRVYIMGRYVAECLSATADQRAICYFMNDVARSLTEGRGQRTTVMSLGPQTPARGRGPLARPRRRTLANATTGQKSR